MSFSITVTGTVDEIRGALAAESLRLTDQSKKEFDAVAPALETILDQQVGDARVHLSANGHAVFDATGTKTFGACSVNVKPAQT